MATVCSHIIIGFLIAFCGVNIELQPLSHHQPQLAGYLLHSNQGFIWGKGQKGHSFP